MECFGYSCGREQTSIHQPFINDFLCLIFFKEEPGVLSYDQWVSLYPSNKSSLEKEAKDNTVFTVWWVKSIEVVQAQSIGLSGQLALFTRTGEAILICFSIWFASFRFVSCYCCWRYLFIRLRGGIKMFLLVFGTGPIIQT